VQEERRETEERFLTERRQLVHEMLSISERERQRFGQDLHDGLCQHLIGLKFRSALLQKKLRQQSSPDAEAARSIVTLLDQAIQEAHDLAQGLHPVRLEADGLMCALQDLAANTQSLFNVPCRCRFRHPVLITDNTVAVHLYRIAQEAISNAIKHGRASQLLIGLAVKEDRITIWVKDNGIGFPADRTADGMGLHIMKYRARMIGASLDFRRPRNGGTRLTCVLPLPNP
jgi:signal transduction histidine kinase